MMLCKGNQQQEFLDIVSRNAKRHNKLSEEILYVTRLETETLEFKKEQFNMNEVILNAIDDIVISNLLSNAVKFTAEDAMTISVQ